ncbi:MAG: class II glutamine amidotransferase, partial [Spirochaetes bacterium]|nr:class II glutamine amidotransferase [Spirochaetota bacterium]
MNDKFRDECGVFGIFCDNPENVAPLVYRGLFALQHRGQESAGMAVVNDGKINVHKAAGLVSNVFSPELISQLKGSAALGHVRYSTESANGAENIEPFVTHIKNDFIALAHNGALTNYDAVRELLEDSGMGFSSSNDGEVIVNLLARNYKKGLENTLADTIQIIKGSYAFLLLTKDALIGARDPNGIRPLCLGKLPGKLPGKMPSLPGGGGGWVL